MSYEQAKVLLEKQEALRKQSDELATAMAENETELLNEVCKGWNEAHPDFEDGPRDVADLVITFNWKCADEEGGDRLSEDQKSPIGYCVYDQRTDPGDLDECIFCGAPDERK